MCAQLAIRAGMLSTVEMLHHRGFGVMTSEPLLTLMSTPWGIPYLMAMIIALDLFHDTWFYFAHRLLHWPYFMKRIHYMHHQSRVPSSFSGYRYTLVFPSCPLKTPLPHTASLQQAP
jgi:sterol desaturase/sphingolipid hydroxylase (fatty acid hydroxylase superfamily)